MQIGVSAYSFSQLIQKGEMKQIEVIAKAKEMGFDAIEFAGLIVPEGKTTAEFAVEIKAEADKVGIPIVNYAIGADFINGSEGNLAAEIERVKGEVDIADILGSPCMRHDVFYGTFPASWKGTRTFADVLPQIADGCRAVTEYAASKGIKTMVENHGFVAQDAARVEELVHAVNHTNFGLLIDIGNFTCADENPAVSVGRVKHLAFHCHAKDFHIKSGQEAAPGRGWFNSRGGNWLRGAIIGHGNVPVAQCVRTIVKGGFDGVFSVEFEGMENPIEGIEIGQENLRRFVKMAQED